MSTSATVAIVPPRTIQGTAPGIFHLVGPDGRILLVDIVRGLLILLMASSHTVGLAGVSSDNFLRSRFWLPIGWTTDAFITVSGITAAIVYDWVLQPTRAKRSLRRRAWQLLAVMFVSNVLLLMTKYLATHEIQKVAHLHWWIGLFTFQTEYSISGVLAPTAVLLLILPAVNNLRLRFGVVPVAALAVIIAISVQLALRRGGHVLHSILTFGAAFPIIPMVCTGLVGFFVGVALKRFNLRRDVVIKTAILPVGVILAAPFLRSHHLSALISVGLPAMRVFLVCAVGSLVLILPKSRDWNGFFGMLGRFSLLCFLGHRVIINVIVLLGKDLFAMASEVIYAWSMIFTFSCLGFLCFLRTRRPSFDAALRRVYL